MGHSRAVTGLIYLYLFYNYINLQCSHQEVLRASSNLPLRHEFLGIRGLSVAVPANLAPPFLPAHKIWSYVHVKLLLGDQKKWKLQGAKSSKYGGFKSWICFTVWHSVGCRALSCCRHKPEDNKPRRFVSNCWLKLMPNNNTLIFTALEHKVITGPFLFQTVHNFSCSHFNELCICTCNNQSLIHVQNPLFKGNNFSSG